MTEIEKLEQAIATLEAQRETLGAVVVETMLAPAREKLATLRAASTAADQQRKIVTVLFADVSGFTAMSEALDAEEVSDTMNSLWQLLDAVITEHGGKIDKHLGDGVMALWGADAAQEDDAENALRAALAMQAALQKLTLPSARVQPKIEMRVGVNTGPVLLGAVGTVGEVTALGDTVNLASRLQNHAPLGGVLISHDTYRHVRGVFVAHPQPLLTIKGKTEPVQTYVIERLKPRAFRLETRGVEGIETRTIGREKEVAQLQAAARATIFAKQLRAITLVGEAGVGKSRLLYEIDNWVDLLPDVVWYFRGRITQSQMHLPYALLRNMFAFRFEILENDSPEVARQKFEVGITELMQASSASTLEIAHFLGHLLGLDFAASPYLRGILQDARQIRDRAFHSLVQFFRAVSQRLPTVMYLEDIHWADEGSLNLLEYLMGTDQNLALFVVCLARPTLFERRPTWGAVATQQGVHHQVLLQPLTKEATRQLVEEILRKVIGLPQTLRELIVNSAEGNPFYVEELVKMFIDEGVIKAENDETWRVEPTRLAAVRVPPTLVGVIQARLDSLPAAERSLLHRAAVIGRVFWDKAVAFLEQSTSSEAQWQAIENELEALRRKELIFRHDDSAFAGTREYTFKHVLMQEVTYENILKRHRRQYHLQTATWLLAQSESSGLTDDKFYYAGLMAEHYERAEENLQARVWYARAGERAFAAFAPQDAISYFQRALQLSQVAPPEAYTLAQWHAGLGRALQMQAHFSAAVQAFREMRDLAVTCGDVPLQALACANISWALDGLGDNRQALEMAAEAEQLARQVNAQPELAQALFRKGWVHYRLGDSSAALELGQQALALGATLGDLNAQANSYRLLGAAHYVLSHHVAAIEAQQQALEIYRQQGDLSGERVMLNNLGDGARLRGDYETAIAYLERAIKLAQQTGNREGELIAMANLASAQTGRGQYALAVTLVRKVLVGVAEMTSSILAFANMTLARAHLGLGQLGEAGTLAHHSLQLARKTETVEDVAEAWQVLGLIAAAHGGQFTQTDTIYSAPACFAESLRLNTEMGATAERAKVLRDWADYEQKYGNPTQSAAFAAEARELFAQLQMTYELARLSTLST